MMLYLAYLGETRMLERSHLEWIGVPCNFSNALMWEQTATGTWKWRKVWQFCSLPFSPFVLQESCNICAAIFVLVIKMQTFASWQIWGETGRSQRQEHIPEREAASKAAKWTGQQPRQRTFSRHQASFAGKTSASRSLPYGCVLFETMRVVCSISIF